MNMLFSVIFLCTSMQLFAQQASDVKSYWTDPRVNRSQFMYELNKLPEYAKSNQSALNELDTILDAWVKGRQLLYPRGYKEAATKIETTFFRYLHQRDHVACNNMLPLMLKRRMHHNDALFLPFHILKPDARSEAQSDAIWVLDIMDDDDLLKEIVSTGKETIKTALPFIPSALRKRILKHKDAEVGDHLRHRHAIQQNLSGNMKTIEDFDTECEIVAADCEFEERKEMRFKELAKAAQKTADIESKIVPK